MEPSKGNGENFAHEIYRLIGIAELLGSHSKKDRKLGEYLYKTLVPGFHYKLKHGGDSEPYLEILRYMGLIESYEYKEAKKHAEEWFMYKWGNVITSL